MVFPPRIPDYRARAPTTTERQSTPDRHVSTSMVNTRNGFEHPSRRACAKRSEIDGDRHLSISEPDNPSASPSPSLELCAVGQEREQVGHGHGAAPRFVSSHPTPLISIPITVDRHHHKASSRQNLGCQKVRNHPIDVGRVVEPVHVNARGQTGGWAATLVA